MPVLERSVVIHAPIRMLYEFHLYTPNVRLIQPLGFKVMWVKMPPEVREGAEVELRLRAYGFSQTWRVVWDEIVAPSGDPARARLADRAVRSPFRSFRHRREFVAESESSTLMTELVEYEPPWGRAGRWLQPLIQAELDGMFYVRQRLTKRVLEASCQRCPPPSDSASASALLGVQQEINRRLSDG
jgi:ligand-binding SRPBCC domain-containing protein